MQGFLSLTHGADVAVYNDGVPQNVPSSAINHGMDDLSWLTPDMIERIEVIKGPFSALYRQASDLGVGQSMVQSELLCQPSESRRGLKRQVLDTRKPLAEFEFRSLPRALAGRFAVAPNDPIHCIDKDI
jgi:hypothetical protein